MALNWTMLNPNGAPVPLPNELSITTIESPTFGSNYLAFDVRPSAGGGLTDGTKVEIRFKDRAMFEFERAIYMKRQAASEEEDGLPTYTSPQAAGSSSVTMVGGVPIENPPGYDV
ncbi:hypothetical protein BD779DRAFT_1493010 [Infundibulicybe gibba]|nr:hypothetical protein BD779DRAFT_1493010 [Infundibulicybe gibba]